LPDSARPKLARTRRAVPERGNEELRHRRHWSRESRVSGKGLRFRLPLRRSEPTSTPQDQSTATISSDIAAPGAAFAPPERTSFRVGDGPGRSDCDRASIPIRL
jgi:hypothetical protein